ncbi:rCG26990 [Rattus norvegicus]|uniref:RCG26990 n=1 Tax=Rattus norvegicus TaxID=10116 RepID=A6HNT8_RAT|nr:rCG26990 [Rattus norvegicus]
MTVWRAVQFLLKESPGKHLWLLAFLCLPLLGNHGHRWRRKVLSPVWKLKLATLTGL